MSALAEPLSPTAPATTAGPPSEIPIEGIELGQLALAGAIDRTRIRERRRPVGDVGLPAGTSAARQQRLLDELEIYGPDPAGAEVVFAEGVVVIAERDGSRTMVFEAGDSSNGTELGRYAEYVHDPRTDTRHTRRLNVGELWAVCAEIDPGAAAELAHKAAAIGRGSGKRAHRRRAAVRESLARAQDGELIGLRRLQGAILDGLAGGRTLVEMCRAARYVLDDPADQGLVSDRGGSGEPKPETTWLIRKAGLASWNAGHGSGAYRIARVARYESAVRLCRAAALAPVELGL